MSNSTKQLGNVYAHEPENVAQLKTRFPEQFPRNGEFDGGCYTWPDGWMSIVTQICERVDAEALDVAWIQIKEKYGGLRMYYYGMQPRLDVLVSDGSLWSSKAVVEGIDSAFFVWLGECEARSANTCCCCGAPGTLELFGRWLLPICSACEPAVRAFRKCGHPAPTDPKGA